MDCDSADDSKQPNPSRLGAGSFVVIGGVQVISDRVGLLEREIGKLCMHVGFPRPSLRPRLCCRANYGRSVDQRLKVLAGGRRELGAVRGHTT